MLDKPAKDTEEREAKPKDTTGSKKTLDPAMTTSKLITAGTLLHKEQKALKPNHAKLFRQTKPEALKNGLLHIKLPKAEILGTLKAKWPQPLKDKLRKPHKVRPPASGRNRATPRTPAKDTTPKATAKKSAGRDQSSSTMAK